MRRSSIIQWEMTTTSLILLLCTSWFIVRGGSDVVITEEQPQYQHQHYRTSNDDVHQKNDNIESSTSSEDIIINHKQDMNEPSQRPSSVQPVDTTKTTTTTTTTTSLVENDSSPLLVIGDDDDDDDDIGDNDVENYDTNTDIFHEQIDLQDDVNNNDNTNNNTTETQENDDNENIIVVSLVDGTLVGLSSMNGRTIWKQQAPPVPSTTTRQYNNDDNNNNDKQYHHPLVKPLVSTTTTVGGRSTSTTSTNIDRYKVKTVAVPSILDGKVYLTSTSEDCSNNNHDTDSSSSSSSSSCYMVEDTVTTTIHNLIHRTPFVDTKNHGRIYTSQRQSVAVAIHSTTGIPIRTISSSSTTTSGQDVTETSIDPPYYAVSDSKHDTTTKKNTNNNNNNDNNNDDILWLGRTDYTITIHEPNTGEIDVQFTMAEMMSIHDMLLIDEQNQNDHQQNNMNDNDKQSKKSDQILRQYLLPHIDDHAIVANQFVASATTKTPRDIPNYGMIATPNGHIAYRNIHTGQIVWVAEESFTNTPIVYAFDASSGHTLPVDIVPDAISPHGTTEYVAMELQRQIYERHHYNIKSNNNHDITKRTNHPYDEINEPVFGSLPGSGQIYAIPLLSKVTNTVTEGGLQSNYFYNSNNNNNDIDNEYSHGRYQSHNDQQYFAGQSIPDAAKAYVSGTNNVNNNNQYYYNQHHNFGTSCHTGSPYYPRCLNYGTNTGNHLHHHKQFQNSFPNSFTNTALHQRRQQYHSTDGMYDDDDDTESNNAIVPFYHPDYGYQYIPPDHFYTIHTKQWEEQYRRRKRYKKILRILGSWLLPVVFTIFVTSFELGRRKRYKQNGDSESKLVLNNNGKLIDSNTDEGIIQVNEDVILGHGGHGTVVYKGMLEGRQVAVKRMLKTYNASADREISLLIESDGHPNVVRYHLKEVRGDFVYLALELCDLSLHDLIGHIRSRLDQIGIEQTEERLTLFNATKDVLLQITKGAEHLHRLRIVHRDLKPANILLANKRNHKSNKNDTASSSFICETFIRGDYIAKISDMGLGKQLVGQSSYGGSLYNGSSFRGESNGVQSSIIGIGPGSVGWQAPEVMKLRATSDISVKSDDACNYNETGSDFSPMDVPSNSRTSRSVDVFSLGCIFYSSLIPGSHPFGEWYEREANIMHNKPNLKALESISLEAYDLVSLMLQRDPADRPTTKQIGDHPFFWTSSRRLSLLCDLSDRLEQDGVNASSANDDTSFHMTLLAVEKNALKVVGTSWDRVLDPDLIMNVQRFRSYDPSSIRDLLRLIRNKFHHFDELPDNFKESIGSKPEGLSQYFESKFPRLLLHAFYVCQSIYPSDDILSLKYSIPSARKSAKTNIMLNVPLVKTSENVDDPFSQGEPVEANFQSSDAVPNLLNCMDEPLRNGSVLPSNGVNDISSKDLLPVNNTAENLSTDVCNESVDSTTDEDVIIWFGSTAAKTFQCRGWYRCDEEWQHQSELISRRRDVNLVKCAEDPKYRTRLCNHWDTSLGTFCPMRKKNKCIFAHGPVELRVKEAKRNRWGKLVDDNGDCNNQNHSGGEDTYGAARSIETERKQEGKWNTKTGNGTKKTSGATPKKKTAKETLAD